MAFGYYSPVTVQTGQVPSTQTNFPMLISYTDNRLKTVANGGHVQNASGFDIRPYSDSALSSPLTFQLTYYNASTGQVVLWVNVGSLADGTIVHLAYGDLGLASDGSSFATWDTNYGAVWHLGDGTTVGLADSTSNANTLTNHSAVAVTGQISGGVTTNGSSTYLNAAQSSSLDAPKTANKLTISLWVKNGSTGQTNKYILNYNNTGDDWTILYGYVANTYEAYLGAGAIRHTIKGSVSDTNWHKIDVCLDGAADTLKLYYDGTQTYSAAETQNLTQATGGFFLGQSGSSANWFSGSFDEVRISNIARAANWVTTEYNNQSAPTTFAVLGTEVVSTSVSAGPAFLAKVGSFACATSTGLQSVTGVGFRPVAVILWGNQRTSDGIASDAMLSFGVATATAQRCIQTRADAVDPSATGFAYTDAKCVKFNTTAPAIQFEAGIHSMDADGFTLNVTSADATARVGIYLALGGVGVNAYLGTGTTPAATGNQSITGVGFQPDAVLFFWPYASTSAPPFTSNSAGNDHFGFGLGVGISSAARWALGATLSDNQSAGSNKYDFNSASKCIDIGTTAGFTSVGSADYVSADADGLTVNWSNRSTGNYYFFLALKGVSVAAGVTLQKTSTGTVSVSGLNFRPTAVLLATSAQTGTGQTSTDARLSIGAATSTTDRGCTAITATENADSQSALDRTKAMKVYDPTTTVACAADLSSFDAGFTLNWTTADGSARRIYYLAFGELPRFGGWLPGRQAVKRANFF